MRLQHNQYRPTLELLEKRDLPTSAMLSGGYLYVTSTSAHDYISVSQSNGRLSVANTTITVGSARVSSVADSQVNKVVVYAYGGGDVINLRPSSATTVTEDSYIYAGGSGNQVYGGNGSNYIVGGSGGRNTLVGGIKTDYLVAGHATDTLRGGGGFDWYYRAITASAPFKDGQLVSDVRQGQAPTCQTDAALAEAAKGGFNFANSIRYLGGTQYDIKLAGGAVHETVSFNGWYNSDDPIPAASGEFWTILMHRARLEYKGVNSNVHYTMAQWDAMNASSRGQLYSVKEALRDFTGRTTTYMLMSSAGTAQAMQASLARGDLIVASTPQGGGLSSDGIARNHAYAVMAVYYEGGMWKVRLYNPWAMDSASGRTIDSLSGKPASNQGFITLSWAQFTSTKNFHGISRAVANAAQSAYFRTLSGNRE